MYTDAKKLYLIQEVLKVTNEATLMELEAIIARSKDKVEKKPSIYDFVGILTKEEANEMKKVIEETSETIQADDWKYGRQVN